MEKYRGIIVCILLFCILSGCAGMNTSHTATDAPKERGLRIAIVTGANSIDDNSFNSEIYQGVKQYKKENPDATVEIIRTKNSNSDAASNDKSVEQVNQISDEYDVVICCGFYYAKIGSIVKKHKKVKYILVDTVPLDAAGEEHIYSNVYAMTFAEQEGGFLAGLESSTKKVAVINGVGYPSNVNYQLGFESGVNYCNKKYRKNITIIEDPAYAGTDTTNANIGGNYIGNFNDKKKGRTVAKSFIKKGCDILFVAAGGAGLGAFDAAKKTDYVKVIGCDVDQYQDGYSKKRNVILTSVLKLMGKNVKKQLTVVQKNTFRGENVELEAKDNSTDFVYDKAHCQLSDETIQRMKEAYDLIKKGVIVPAANFNGYQPDDFPGINK